MNRAQDGGLCFFSELSEHQISADEFFNVVLLDSLARNFGLKNVLISYLTRRADSSRGPTATACWRITRDTRIAAACPRMWCVRPCIGRRCRTT